MGMAGGTPTRVQVSLPAAWAGGRDPREVLSARHCDMDSDTVDVSIAGSPPAEPRWVDTECINAQQVMSYLAEFHCEGGTVVVVTHDPFADQYAQRTILMDHGKVGVCTGPSLEREVSTSPNTK